MNKIFNRSALIFGEEGIKKLNSKNVLVFGVGGVGSAVLEGLVRGGIGNLTVVDSDEFSITNINRQILATQKAVGLKKVEVAKKRALEINPDVKVETICGFVTKDNLLNIDFKNYDYVVDAIDLISGKLEIIKECKKYNIPIISAMGAGNKLSPELFRVSDIFKTKVCPLCRVLRKLLKDNGINSLKVVYSEEEPCKLKEEEVNKYGEKKGNLVSPSSVSFVPPVMGYIIAGEVIKDLVK